MGISGSGKTTVGQELARRLNLPFYDADDFHPGANIQKMANGQPLNDEDRRPWLDILGRKIEEWEQDRKGGAVLACSALKESYRRKLATIPDDRLHWVLLDGTKKLIKRRMEQRKHHFFEAALIDSQLADLEKPDYGIHVDINQSPTEIVEVILKILNNTYGRDEQDNRGLYNSY